MCPQMAHDEHSMSVQPLDRGLPSAVYATEAGFSLQERLSVLSRYRYVAGTTFLLVLIIAAFQIYTAIPMYRATIQLRIQDERTTRVVGIEADDSFYWTDPEPYYQTQYLIIRGSGLARRVIQRPELASAAELRGEGSQAPSLFAAVRSIGTWLTDFPLFGKDAPVEPSAPDETDLESVLTSNFMSRVEVVPVRNTQLVDVSFVAADPELAATAVNALAEEYVQQNLDIRLDAVLKTLDWLGTEITRQQTVVEHSERALGDYRESQNALSLGDRQNIVVSRLNALNDEATRARTNRLQKETQYQQLQALGDLDTLTDTLPSTVATPTVQLANARMNELRRERNLLAERYGDRHPEMVRVTVELQDANAQLRIEVQRATEAIRTEYEAAVIEERNLVAALESQKTASMDLDRKSVDYTILEREAQSNRQVYEQLLQRENELQVASNSNTNNVQVVDLAEVPAGPFSPNPVRDFLFATVIGLALGIGLAFGLDHMDDTVKTPEDVTTSLRLPFLGLVPAVNSKSPPLLSTGQGEPVPHDFGEAFRAIRTSLVFTSSTASTRIVLVTSAQPFEGKTTTSCNLAMALALSDARVLLIEGDMRRPGCTRTSVCKTASACRTC